VESLKTATLALMVRVGLQCESGLAYTGSVAPVSSSFKIPFNFCKIAISSDFPHEMWTSLLHTSGCLMVIITSLRFNYKTTISEACRLRYVTNSWVIQQQVVISS